jgi:hypothetical protein
MYTILISFGGILLVIPVIGLFPSNKEDRFQRMTARSTLAIACFTAAIAVKYLFG